MEVVRTCRNCGHRWDSYEGGSITGGIIDIYTTSATRGSIADLHASQKIREENRRRCPNCNFITDSWEKVRYEYMEIEIPKIPKIQLTRTKEISKALSNHVFFPKDTDTLQKLEKLNDEQYKNFKKLNISEASTYYFPICLLLPLAFLIIGKTPAIINFIVCILFSICHYFFIHRKYMNTTVGKGDNLKMINNWLDGLKSSPTGYVETVSVPFTYKTIGSYIDKLKEDIRMKNKKIDEKNNKKHYQRYRTN